MLSIDQIASYHRDGFLAIEDFATPGGVPGPARPGRRDRRRVRAERAPHGLHDRRAGAHGNREFIDSGAGVWCFFEAEAFGPDGELVQDKALSINKIGHAMHDLDPVFEAFSYTPELAAVAHDVGLADPLALQSMYIFKQPHIGGEVGCHQDAPFLYTDPISVTGFWFAIEDATLDNGCLWAQPGGHRGPLRRVYQRVEDAPDGGDRHDALRRARRHAAARRRRRASCRSSCRPARWSCCTACCRTGATSTAHR